MEHITVILPTFNEAASLQTLIPQIDQALSDLPYRLLVADDNSPDGTSKIALELAKRYPIDVLVRTQNPGLSQSILEGITQAKSDICVVMDADGSHPPSALADMVRPLLDHQADMTIGSRYLKRNSMPDWPFYRQFISRVNAWMALGLAPLTDATSGFMAVRKSQVQWTTINPLGWKVVLEVATKTPSLRVKEVPIVFRDRTLGKSKANLMVQVHYLVHLIKLYQFRFPSFFEFCRFCLVGASGLLIDIAITGTIQGYVGLDLRLAATFGFLAALCSNYILNRNWTFFYGKYAPVLRSFSLYALVAGVGFCARLGVVQLLIAAPYGAHHPWLVSFFALAVGAIVNFIGSRSVVFV